MSTKTRDDTTLRIERLIAATPERLFALWTQPKELVKWWGPEGFTTPAHAIGRLLVVGHVFLRITFAGFDSPKHFC